MNIQWLIDAALVGLLVVFSTSCDPTYSDSSVDPASNVVLVQDRTGVKIGGPAPDFELWNLENQPMTLSGHRGRVIMLNFWATWCGPCRVEMPAMEQLYHVFGRKDCEILAISTDAQGPSVTRPFRDDMRLTFPILHDSDFRVGVTYGTRTLPMTFLVNRHGIITHRIFGARDWFSPEAKQMIQTLIQGS